MPGPSAAQIGDGAVRLEVEAARLDHAAAELARQRAGGPGSGRVCDALARITWAWASRAMRGAPEPGAVVLSAAEADTAWQALADAAAWHAERGDCAECTAAGRCAHRARYEVIAADYALLRGRLGGDQR